MHFLGLVSNCKYASCLGHPFDNEHPRHDGIFWKMPPEKRFIACDVLQCNNFFSWNKLNHPIDQQKRVTVWQHLYNLMNIQCVFHLEPNEKDALCKYLQGIISLPFRPARYFFGENGLSCPPSPKHAEISYSFNVAKVICQKKLVGRADNRNFSHSMARFLFS